MRRKRSAQNYREAISRLRGILRKKPGGTSLLKDWDGHKRDERKLEQRKYRLSTGGDPPRLSISCQFVANSPETVGPNNLTHSPWTFRPVFSCSMQGWTSTSSEVAP